MDLSIIIVNWNVRPLLERCLESIFKETKGLNYEIIVVDNASTDSSVEYLSGESHLLKSMTLKKIFNKTNLGFAKANNQALKIAEGEFILFLNPDTEILEQGIIKALKFMRENKDCGIMGCQLIDANDKIQSSVRNFPNFLAQILIFLKLHHFFPKLLPLKKYFLSDFDYDKEQEVEQVMGAFLMTRRKIIDAIGGFDENFFLWFEEVDFCKRVKEAGWRVIYNPNIKIRHYGAQSFRQVLSYQKQKNYNQSSIYFFKKHHPAWQVKLLKIFHPISLFLARLYEFF